MSVNYSHEKRNNENLEQIIYLDKNNGKNIELKNNLRDFEFSFKLNKMSYLDIKNKKYIYFGFGRLTITSNLGNDYINLFFHDSSLKLRFQGLISIKFTSFSLDINKKNCIKVNNIIGIVHYMNNSGETKTENFLTDIYLYFENENDENEFLNNLIHI